jgi:hypothetical protein
MLTIHILAGDASRTMRIKALLRARISVTIPLVEGTPGGERPPIQHVAGDGVVRISKARFIFAEIAWHFVLRSLDSLTFL